MSLQASLGLLLLEHPPRMTTEKTYGDRRPKMATQGAWASVLNHLPSDAFDPTAKMPDGDPWVFHLARVFDYAQSGIEALTFVTNRYGDGIFEVRNQAGQTLIECVYEALAEQVSKTTENDRGHSVERIANLWGHLLGVAPRAALAMPEDGDNAPGTTWLHRYMNQIQAAMPDYCPDARERADGVLLGTGVDANAKVNGQPVAAAIQDEAGLKLFLDHGLILQQNAGNRLLPDQDLVDLLSQREPRMKRLIGNTCPPAVAPTAAESEGMRSLLSASTKPDVRSALVRLGEWDKAETAQGVPAIWVAIQGSIAILSDLRRPRMVEQARSALQKVDSFGRSPYFHLLVQTTGLDKNKFFDSENGWFVRAAMPGHDTIVTADGRGLYQQVVDHVLDRKREDEHSAWSAIQSYHTSQSVFDAISHEEWWGNDAAQQRLARRLVNHMASKLVVDSRRFRMDLPKPADLRGDVARLHPELKAALSLYAAMKAIHHIYDGCLTGPIDFVPQVWAPQAHLPVHDRDAFEVIRSAMGQTMEAKQRQLDVPPRHDMKDSQRRIVIAKQATSRPHWKATEARWREFQALCLASDLPQARARPRVRA